MKILSTILLITAMAVQANAQDDIEKFFGKYVDDDSFTHVHVTKRMFALFTDLEMDDPDDAELLGAIGKLDGLKAVDFYKNSAFRGYLIQLQMQEFL